ncbi:39S ribosomal protein L43 [Sarcoptes scabiei]|uniref:Large ribosomal subunit protein mL43 n=1 Tax=Sarcoptes scabiei TaxID=52283 RepID=A0A834V824_SARSC|nr:39S ribosomal protein L43 [Sarcoptes scabiei]UXI17354.1 hypothetical protein NH340_JMT03298 [Sarcoptes scabiei]
MKARDLIKFSLDPKLTHNPALPSGYIRNAYYNGVGRYVCQLQRLTIKFCKSGGTSLGVRKFIETKLIDFSRQNPGVVVYIKPRFHRSPVIVSEYLNGQTHWMSIRNFSDTEISWWLEILRTRSGFELTQLLSERNVLIPSVQGIWNPFLNRPTDMIQKSFPCDERSRYRPSLPSATEQLVQIAKESSKIQNVSEFRSNNNDQTL